MQDIARELGLGTRREGAELWVQAMGSDPEERMAKMRSFLERIGQAGRHVSMTRPSEYETVYAVYP